MRLFAHHNAEHTFSSSSIYIILVVVALAATAWAVKLAVARRIK